MESLERGGGRRGFSDVTSAVQQQTMSDIKAELSSVKSLLVAGRAAADASFGSPLSATSATGAGVKPGLPNTRLFRQLSQVRRPTSGSVRSSGRSQRRRSHLRRQPRHLFLKLPWLKPRISRVQQRATRPRSLPRSKRSRWRLQMVRAGCALRRRAQGRCLRTFV